MIIRRLRLTNYRKYTHLDIEFPEGLIGIVGGNGAGKTTLLEAIAFALYGASASRTRAKGVRRDGCADGDRCAVELEFAYNGETYRILRELRGANETQTATLYKGTVAEAQATRPSGVEAAVQKLLGMDYSTFIRSIFARQKEVAVLTNEKPEERRRAIRRMMGIERVEEAIKKLREDKRQKEDFISGAVTAIEDLDEKITAQAKLEEDLGTAQAALAPLETQARRCAKAEAQARTLFDELEKLQRQFNTLNGRHTRVESDLEHLNNQRQDADGELAKLHSSRTELRGLAAKLKEYERVQRRKTELDQAKGVFEEVQTLTAEIAGLTQRAEEQTATLAAQLPKLQAHAGLDRKAAAATAAIKAGEKKLDKIQTDLTKAKAALNETAGLLRKLDADHKQVRAQGPTGHCPTCRRPIGDSLAEINQHFAEERAPLETARQESQQQVNDLSEAEKKQKEAIQTAREKDKAFEKQKAQRDVLNEKITGLRQKLAEARKTLTGKKRRLKQLSRTQYDPEVHRQTDAAYDSLSHTHRRAIGLQRDVERIPAAKVRIKQLKAQAVSKQQEEKDLRGEIAALKFRPERYDKAKAAYQAANTTLRDADKLAAEARKNVAVYGERLEALKREVADKQAKKAQIQTDQVSIQYLAQLEVVFKDFQTHLISRLRPLIGERASVLLDQVTEGRYTHIDLDEDYQISVMDGANLYAVKRFSGGEEDLANLCLRIAISQVVTELTAGSNWGLIALDEVFGSQDRQRRERLLGALQNLTGSFRQIFFITHLEDLQDRAPFVLQIAEAANDTATAQWAK